MRRLLLVVLLALLVTAPRAVTRGEDPKPLLVCPDCGELGTTPRCPEDDEVCVGAHLLVFHQALVFLGTRTGAEATWKDLIGPKGVPDPRLVSALAERYAHAAEVTSFTPWTSALPPSAPSAKRACPRCADYTAEKTCERCAGVTVPASALHFQQVVGYFATLEAREGVANPFAAIVERGGSIDTEKLEALVLDYARASKRRHFQDDRTAWLPLNHAFAQRVREWTPFLVFRAIKEGQDTWRKTHDGYATLEQLLEARLVRGLWNATRAEYKFSVTPSPADPEDSWVATAVPEGGCAGERHYFSNQTGKVWFTWRPIPASVVASGRPPVHAHRAVERPWTQPLGRTEEEREAWAAGVLRRIVAAEVLHAAKKPGWVDLAELVAEKRLPAEVVAGPHLGYAFSFTLAPKREGFAVVAAPTGPEVGRRHFYASERGDLLAADRRIELEEGEPIVHVLPFAGRPRRSTMNGIAYAPGAIGMWATESLYESRWFDALEPLETAIALDGTSAVLWNNLGKAYLELDAECPTGLSASSKLLLGRAIEAEKRSVAASAVSDATYTYMAYGNLARAQVKLAERTGSSDKAAVAGLLAEARTNLESSLALAPDYEHAWLTLADTLVLQAEAASGDERSALARKALDALASSKAARPGHPAYDRAGAALAKAHRLLERRTAAFVALAPISAWDDAAIDRLAAFAEEAADEVESAEKPATEEARADRALLRDARESLTGACERLEKGARSSEGARRAKLARAAARASKALLGDKERARRDYDLAIEASADAAKEALEKERADLER